MFTQQILRSARFICKVQSAIYLFIHIWAGAQQFIQDCMCAQRRLRSACTFAPANQNIHCPSECALDPLLPINCPGNTLIRLRECAGCSGSLLGAHAIVQEILFSNSYLQYPMIPKSGLRGNTQVVLVVRISDKGLFHMFRQKWYLLFSH